MVARSELMKQDEVVFAFDGHGTRKCIVADFDCDGSPIVVFRSSVTSSGYAMDTIQTEESSWIMSGEWDALDPGHPWIEKLAHSN